LWQQRVAVLRRCPIADMTPLARLFALDGDGGIKAAIWGGALAARHACVVGSWHNAFLSVIDFPLPIF
jgi:hypothetical protein